MAHLKKMFMTLTPTHLYSFVFTRCISFLLLSCADHQQTLSLPLSAVPQNLGGSSPSKSAKKEAEDGPLLK